MIYTDFQPERLDRGRKHALDLELGEPFSEIRFPAVVLRGSAPGKTLVVTSGVHGDEYEGVRAVFEVCDELDPAEMTGDLVAVPVANPPAFWAGSRTSPLDGGNLARVFPGDPHRGPTAALAHALGKAVLARADFYVDLHSAGLRWLMPTLAGYDANDARSHDAALAFGAPVVWGHPTVAPGRTISFATQRRIPWLYTEARGGGRIHPDDLRVFRQGVQNLLRHLAILPGPVLPAAPPQWHLYGDGNLDEGLASSKAGFFIPEVDLLQAVRAGQLLGRTLDLHGETIETFRCPADGVVAMLRQFPVVEPGEPLFMLTGTK